MKVFIWVGCFAIFAAVEVAAAMLGYEVNEVVTILLARVLSARYDEKQKQKRAEARRKRK